MRSGKSPAGPAGEWNTSQGVTTRQIRTSSAWRRPCDESVFPTKWQVFDEARTTRREGRELQSSGGGDSGCGGIAGRAGGRGDDELAREPGTDHCARGVVYIQRDRRCRSGRACAFNALGIDDPVSAASRFFAVSPARRPAEGPAWTACVLERRGCFQSACAGRNNLIMVKARRRKSRNGRRSA